MQELDNAYRILDLEPGASMEEVNQAYKDLVFIWHPDRLPKDNVRLIEKAQEKIKQLNQARDYLRTHARVGTEAAYKNESTRYRSRPRPYGRSYTNTAYRQSASYSRQDDSEDSRQPYQNPYRAYQARYARAGYGSYGAYRSPSETDQTQPPNGSTGSDRTQQRSQYTSSTSANGGRPVGGNSAARSDANDGWNNYTTSRPSGSGNAVNTGASRDPSYKVNSDRPRSGSYSRSSSDSGSTSNGSNRSRQVHPDLSGSNLRGANLKEKDFSGRNLSSADLSNADLQDAFLHGVNLNRANLSNANLFRANLLQANLSHANLRGANLIGADLSGADLSGADLSGAKVAVGDRVMVKLTGTILRATIMPDGTINA